MHGRKKTHTQRRLAAILAADMVGFSRMMEADEAGTLTALKSRRRDILDPLVAKHQGRIFNTTGDGVLVEFGSAVNAVQCAVELQQGNLRRPIKMYWRPSASSAADWHKLG